MSLNPTTEHFDVIIVGSGVAGALAADRLVKKGKNVCIIEAGGFATDERNRDRMLDYYVGSPSKATDAPICGDEVLAEQPNPRRSPDGLNIDKLPDGANYYYFPPDYATPNDPQKRDKFLSYYERVVGGSTWHWQGIYVRMIPSDFTMSDFGIDTSKLTSDPGNFSLDWPLRIRSSNLTTSRPNRSLAFPAIRRTNVCTGASGATGSGRSPIRCHRSSRVILIGRSHRLSGRSASRSAPRYPKSMSKG